jgi:hypothetical protein
MVRNVNGPSLTRLVALVVFSGVEGRRGLSTSAEAHHLLMVREVRTSVQKEKRPLSLVFLQGENHSVRRWLRIE